MNKREAIAQAQKRVHIVGRCTVVGPYRDSDPTGPYTEVQAACYSAAREHRTAWVARLALSLMGVNHEDVDYHTCTAFGRASERVNYTLRRLGA